MVKGDFKSTVVTQRLIDEQITIYPYGSHKISACDLQHTSTIFKENIKNLYEVLKVL